MMHIITGFSTRPLQLLTFLWLAFAAGSPALADQPSVGYFTGVELTPIGAADIKTAETEPAVALIFELTEDTVQATRQFSAWYNSPDRPQVNAFAIAVVPPELSAEVAAEAITQRKLPMPVFRAEADMLLGDAYRLVVLNDDAEVARFETMDLAGTYKALQEAGVDASMPVPALEPEPAPAPEAEPAPAETPAPPVDLDAPAPAATPASEEPLLLGGKGDNGIYINNLYQMRVQFPPGWQYRVAGKRDGAVAVLPAGGQMDMRIWAMPAGDITTPQAYIDQRLDTIARRNSTRVNIERRLEVVIGGQRSLDVTYTYTVPLNSAIPARGGLIWRGRMRVFVQDDVIKAAGVSAPSAEFMAAFPLIDSFIRSFENVSGENFPDGRYSSPTTI